MVVQLADVLLADGSHVVVHYDQSSSRQSPAPFNRLLQAKQSNFHVTDSVDVVWGEWSIVQATLNCLATLSNTNQEFDYVTLLSGSCYLTKPTSLLDNYLIRQKGMEFIESHDGENYRWVTDGLQTERWLYYHFLNWRKTPFLFTQCLRAQRLLGIERTVPLGISPRIGSQWWTLTWSTLLKILQLAQDHSLVNFFRKTWIPDELFFQTMVHHVVADKNLISNKSLMQCNFEYGGKPRIFYNDNYCELISSEFFFARKISKAASCLRSELDIVSKMNISSFTAQILRPLAPATSMLRPALMGTVSPFSYTFFRPEKQSDTQAGQLELHSLETSFFLVLSCNNVRLTEIYTTLSQHPELSCHGRLFDDNGKGKGSGFFTDYASKKTLLRKKLDHSSNKFPGFLANPIEDRSIHEMLWWLIVELGCIVIYDKSKTDDSPDITLSSVLRLLVDKECQKDRIVDPVSPLGVYIRICSEIFQLEQIGVSAWIENIVAETGKHYIQSGADMTDEHLAETLASITKAQSS